MARSLRELAAAVQGLARTVLIVEKNNCPLRWGEGRAARVPTAFATAYPDARFEAVTRANYDLFLLPVLRLVE